RTQSDAVSTPSDAALRSTVKHRTQAESIAQPTDAPARAEVAARALAEALTTPADTVVRDPLRTVRALYEAISDAIAAGLFGSVPGQVTPGAFSPAAIPAMASTTAPEWLPGRMRPA